MAKHLGKQVTIKKVLSSEEYLIYECKGYTWNRDMFTTQTQLEKELGNIKRELRL